LDYRVQEIIGRTIAQSFPGIPDEKTRPPGFPPCDFQTEFLDRRFVVFLDDAALVRGLVEEIEPANSLPVREQLLERGLYFQFFDVSPSGRRVSALSKLCSSRPEVKNAKQIRS
jgi:hypothetical protein